MLTTLNPVRAVRAFDSALNSTTGSRIQPTAGVTIRLSARMMACDFSVIMNPGPTEHIEVAGESLELIHTIEGWLSIYRESSELSGVNRMAGESPVSVRRELFDLLEKAVEIHVRTDGAFDIASGSLTRLWRACRREYRIPVQQEIDVALMQAGLINVDLQPKSHSVSFRYPGIVLDPGAIGKGYALDEACHWLENSRRGPEAFLLHGGHSSLIARGGHNGHQGWPVGLGNPLFTEKRLGTLLLRDQAMATSGSNIQFFRHEGKRYGHILNPGTGWPVDGMLSVTVLAPSAALADALSTAFFVMGVEKPDSVARIGRTSVLFCCPFPTREAKFTPPSSTFRKNSLSGTKTR